MTLLLLVVAFPILATARVARLVTQDQVTQPMRAWLLDRITHDKAQRAVLRAHDQAVNDALQAGTPPPANRPELPPLKRPTTATTRAWFSYLVTCRWCASVWTAFVITLGVRALMTTDIPLVNSAPVPWDWTDFAVVPLWALSASYAVGWLFDQERS